MQQKLSDLHLNVHPSWRAPLREVAEQISSLGEFLRNEVAAGRGYLPAGENILRAFRSDFASVRVLIVGQDPYPTPGQAIGLSFAVSPDTRPVPRSLQNIYRELRGDLDIATPIHGDLSAWSEQGVLLLNRVLTVSPGVAGSHRRKGWEAVTDHAIQSLVERGKPLVAILWGKDAQSLAPCLKSTPIIQSAHPSPLSANRGFFGSKPFSQANEYLKNQGAEPIDWRIPQ